MFSYLHLRDLFVWIDYRPVNSQVSAQVGIYLPFYDMFRDLLEELSQDKAPATTKYVPLMAGALARSLACTVCYPIELARTRMQVSFVCISSGNSGFLECVMCAMLQ